MDVTLCLNKYVIVKSLHSSLNPGFLDINIVRNNRVANLPSVRDLLLNLLLQADALSAKKTSHWANKCPNKGSTKSIAAIFDTTLEPEWWDDAGALCKAQERADEEKGHVFIRIVLNFEEGILCIYT